MYMNVCWSFIQGKVLVFDDNKCNSFQVEIRYLIGGKVVASNDYPEVLSCNQARR